MQWRNSVNTIKMKLYVSHVRFCGYTSRLSHLLVVVTYFNGSLAQLAEQGTFNPKVAGSTPARPTIVIAWRCVPQIKAIMVGYRSKM